MKKLYALLASIGVIGLTGCTSTPVKINEGTISARTFSFVDPTAKSAPEYSDDRAFVHSQIQNAITKNLSSRGVQRVPKGGDITVAYLVVIGNNVATKSIREYFGYSEDISDLHDRAHMAYTGSGNPNHFEGGTLLIDLIDGKTFKPLSRGHATRPILKHLPSNVRAEAIQDVVDEILKDAHISAR